MRDSNASTNAAGSSIPTLQSEAPKKIVGVIPWRVFSTARNLPLSSTQWTLIELDLEFALVVDFAASNPTGNQFSIDVHDFMSTIGDDATLFEYAMTASVGLAGDF